MTREINGRIVMRVSDDGTRCAAECPHRRLTQHPSAALGRSSAYRCAAFGGRLDGRSRAAACIAAEQAAASVPSCEAETLEAYAVWMQGQPSVMSREGTVRLMREHAATLRARGRTGLPQVFGAADDHIDGGARALDASEALREAPHADDLAVERFAVAMKAKLAKKREQGRGGWEDPKQTEVSFLAKLLVEHLAKGDPVDVANFAMMLHQRDAGFDVLRDANAEQRAHAAAIARSCDRPPAQALREARVQGMREARECVVEVARETPFGNAYADLDDAKEAIDAAIEAVRKGER